jgi:hypothetical protein
MSDIYTKVDIFQRETLIFASLDLKGSLLPLRFKLRVVGDPRGRLPEGLVIYLSQSVKEPGPDNYEVKIDGEAILEMNRKGDHVFRYGDSKT